MTPENPQAPFNPGASAPAAAPPTPTTQPMPTAQSAPAPQQQIPTKKKFPIAPVIGVIGFLVVALAAFLVVTSMGLFNHDPIIGHYEIYATTRSGVDDSDNIAGIKLMGLTITAEFNRNGTGKISSTSTRYEGEDIVNFTWRDGEIKISNKDKDMPLKLNSMTNYELVDNDYVLFYDSDSASTKIKFKRVEEKQE